MDKENKFLGITVGGGHSNEIKNLFNEIYKNRVKCK